MSRTEIEEVISGSQDHGTKVDQLAKIRGWFRPQDESAFYPVLQDYLEEKIHLDEVSSRLFGPIDEKISASKLDDVDFMDLWYSVIHSARRISYRDAHKHNSVIELVAAFKNHKVSGNEKYNYLYNSLTDFSMACREAYNDQPEVTKNGFFDIEVEAWASVNHFFALVTAQGLSDLSIFAIWSMREALEVPQEDGKDATVAQKLDAYVPAASAWVIATGQELYNRKEDLTPTDPKQGNPAKGGALWKGKAEFSRERWAFWKQRFFEIGGLEDVREKTRNVAKDAVLGMERAETFELIH
ncbi:hypothetical protein BKA66DRAFT_514692 [Pyrenochaeta sp. MPI-SDFR-AT-0127]|nr:hypothetical protein BKA66DRAFT_514692 [Pyrenochaeta sp. MPI-SDFR-AT-0127]